MSKSPLRRYNLSIIERKERFLKAITYDPDLNFSQIRERLGIAGGTARKWAKEAKDGEGREWLEKNER